MSTIEKYHTKEGKILDRQDAIGHPDLRTPDDKSTIQDPDFAVENGIATEVSSNSGLFRGEKPDSINAFSGTTIQPPGPYQGNIPTHFQAASYVSPNGLSFTDTQPAQIYIKNNHGFNIRDDEYDLKAAEALAENNPDIIVAPPEEIGLRLKSEYQLNADPETATLITFKDPAGTPGHSSCPATQAIVNHENANATLAPPGHPQGDIAWSTKGVHPLTGEAHLKPLPLNDMSNPSALIDNAITYDGILELDVIPSTIYFVAREDASFSFSGLAEGRVSKQILLENANQVESYSTCVEDQDPDLYCITGSGEPDQEGGRAGTVTITITNNGEDCQLSFPKLPDGEALKDLLPDATNPSIADLLPPFAGGSLAADGPQDYGTIHPPGEISEVPIPGTALLMMSGLAALGIKRAFTRTIQNKASKAPETSPTTDTPEILQPE